MMGAAGSVAGSLCPPVPERHRRLAGQPGPRQVARYWVSRGWTLYRRVG